MLRGTIAEKFRFMGSRDEKMLGAIMFTYGLLTSFVLSGASRNHKLQRPHPRNLVYVGYVLCGLSAGMAALLLGSAVMGQTPPFLA